MTTIASDGKTVAADGLRCAGSEPIEYDCQKLRVVDGVVYGFTGVYRCFDPALKWHKDGCSAADLPKVGSNENWTLIVFKTDAAYTFHDASPYIERYPYPCAFGSGADYATAILAIGKSSKEAVEVAAMKNLWTGGKITVMDIPVAATELHIAREAAE